MPERKPRNENEHYITQNREGSTFRPQMVYLLIKGPSYRGLDFDAREKVRESLRKQLEIHGIRFVEYGWVWDEEDRCLLVVGQYAHPDDASSWRNALETMGFEICIRTSLPGNES